MLGDQNDVGLSVRCAERDVAGLPAHDLDDGNAPMTLGRGTNALDALRGHHDRYGVTRRDVIHDLIEIEDGAGRRAFVAEAAFHAWFVDSHPFVRLAWIIQTQVVINRLGRQYGRQALGKRWQAVECAVAADTYQSFDPQFSQARYKEVACILVVRVNVIAR